MRIKYLQMATSEDLVVCEQVDGDEEVMMLVEERNVMDDDEIENEVIELEFENDEGMNDGTIEENLPETAEASISDTVVEFLPLKKRKAPFGGFLDSLHVPVSTYRRTSDAVKKCFVPFVKIP